MSAIQKAEEARFRDHVRRLSVRNFPGNNDGFDDELTELGKVDQRVRSNLDEFYTGSLGSSMAKNRFDDVKPNEQTIVRLRPISKRGDGTYINANYIDARDTMGVPFVYIATQAPMQNTVLDFWRMIYENDVAFVVMLCAVKENGKVKSETYWPALGQVYDLGLLSIATLSENVRSDSVHRTLLLRTVRGDEKEIYHMQYLAWPDQGIPTTSIPLMEMVQAIGKSRRSVESPIVVHCSGGIGRTGVFIAMHIALAQFQLERTDISIMRIVRFLKLCRSGMVQRKDQYIYLYYSVQREMERMILSAERGVNLLDIRPRDKPIPAQAITDQTTRPRLVGQPTVNGFLPSESVRLLPEDSQSLWTARSLANLLRTKRDETNRRRRDHSPGRQHSHHRMHPSRGGDAGRRDVVTDLAAMQDYLRRNPSMRARVEVPPALPAPPLPDARTRSPPTSNIPKGSYARGGKSYHSDPHGRHSRSHANSPLPRSSDSWALLPTSASPTPHRVDTAAQAKLEAELLRIQSLNRRMRFCGTTGVGGVEEDVSAPIVTSRTPMERTRTPLSITRETPRTQESTPRAAVFTARERSLPDNDDDMAYLRRRVVTSDDWRRL